ncbi:hypothetical protein [Frankia tisae]|uniref:hypothetical protein n=1 Tax=Frankia tisae TaxID=2950104 RepID=UPI0021BF87C5|nr:hypothetical protein [Frankia tisae]
MTGRLSMRTNFAWVAGSSILFQGCQWLIVASLAHMSGSATVGRFAFALAVTAPPFLLANLSLRVVLATDARSQFRFVDYLALRLCCLLLTVVGILAGALLACRSRSEAMLITAVAAAKTCDSVSDIVYGLLQKYEKMDRIAVSRVAQGTLQFLAFFAAYRVSESLLVAVAAWGAMSAAITLSYDLRSIRMIVGRWPQEMVRGDGPDRLGTRMGRLLRLSAPLAGTAVLGALIGNVPIYVLNHWQSANEVGVFSAQMRLVMALGLAFAALMDVVTPRLASYHAQAPAEFLRLLRTMLLIGVGNAVLGLVGAVFAGGGILRVLYGPEYAEPGVFVILVGGMGVNLLAVVLASTLAAARIYTAQFWAGLVQFAVTVGLLVGLVPRMGVSGAATAFIAGLGCYAGVLALCVRRLLRSLSDAAGQAEPVSLRDLQIPLPRAGHPDPATIRREPGQTPG